MPQQHRPHAAVGSGAPDRLGQDRWWSLLNALLSALREQTLAQHVAHRQRLARRLLERLAPPVAWVLPAADSRMVTWAITECLRWAAEQDRPDGRPCGSPLPPHAWRGSRPWRPLLALLALHGLQPVPDLPDRYRARREEPAFEHLAGLWEVAPSSIYRCADRARKRLLLQWVRRWDVERQIALALHLQQALEAGVGRGLLASNAVAAEAADPHALSAGAEALAALWQTLRKGDVQALAAVIARHGMPLAGQPVADGLLGQAAEGLPWRAHAVQLALARARLARVRGAGVDQLRLLDEALRMAEDAALLGEVRTERARLFERSDVDRACAEYRTAIQQYQQALRQPSVREGVHEGLIEALVRLGFLHTQRNDPASRPILEQAQRLAEQQTPGSDTQGLLEHAWGEQLRREGRLDPALEHTHRALQCYERSGNAAQQLRAMCTLAMIHGYLGQLDPARAYAGQVLALAARGVVDPHTVAATSLNLGAACFMAGLASEAIGHYRQALQVATQAGLRTLMGRAHYNLAEAHYRRLQLDSDADDERHGDHHAALSRALWDLSGDRAALEATGRLKATVLGGNEPLIYDRMLSGELLTHFDEMSAIQTQRLRLVTLPAEPAAQVQARLAIATAYTTIAVKEREAALRLMHDAGLAQDFAPALAALTRQFEQALSESERLAAAWARARGCPTPPGALLAVSTRALQHAGLGKRDYAQMCRLSPATASKHLGLMVGLGLLRQSGRGPATRYHAVLSTASA